MMILPIGSGKGGVGKSLLATNLSIALAEAGRKVVLADLDLGASNAHTMLGIRSVNRGIRTFLSVPRMSFAEIVLPTEYNGLSFIPGDAEVPGIANLKAVQKKRLVRCLESLAADFLVLDLGPGAGANSLDFFLMSALGIVVTTPALTAVLNAYLFLKNVVFRSAVLGRGEGVPRPRGARGAPPRSGRAAEGLRAPHPRAHQPRGSPEPCPSGGRPGPAAAAPCAQHAGGPG